MALVVLKSGTFILATVLLFSPALCTPHTHSDIVARQANRHELLNPRVDFTQAEIMLTLLRSSVDGSDPQMIESVLNAHGTVLIISQQNISRAVTRDQYRTLLLSLARDGLPDITPVDGSERARRGIEGLRKDVWPALRWGRSNTNILAERIEAIKRLDLVREARVLAARFLPETVKLAPHLNVVMGGRAGAATLEGDEIYFDVLATSYRAANGTLDYPTPAQVTEYFAHETHHVGLSQILNRTRSRLRLDSREQRAFSFLTALVMEGSASYLINGRRSLDAMRRDRQFMENFEKGNELQRLSQQVLRSVLENGLDGEAYEKATTPFLGSGWHVAGALMLATIDEAGGLGAVMKVLRDPRKLLVAFNRATAKLKSTSVRTSFDKSLAKRISSMGAIY